MVYGAGFLSFVASDTESVARCPVEFRVSGLTVMAVGAGEFIPMKAVVEDDITVVGFVRERCCAGSPSEDKDQQDVESFRAHCPYEPLSKIPLIIVLSQFHCQAKCIHMRLVFNTPGVLSFATYLVLKRVIDNPSVINVGETDMDEEVVELPIDGVLDLHSFRPGDLGELVPDYLAACQDEGILSVRIIHGKGVGHLRRSVHAILARSPIVASFRLAGEESGGWGATIVQLHRRT